MPRLILPGGTDVAEMALFSIDALPSDHCPGSSDLAAMEEQRLVVRFDTGGDGGYLLHAYVDEQIPGDIMNYCVADDAIRGKLRVEQGRLGFGGVESLYRNFKPNHNIRSDGRIPPGEYDVVAYHTDYPEELIEQAIRAGIGEKSLKLLAAPGFVVLPAFVLFAMAAASHAWLLAGFVIACAWLGLRLLANRPEFRQIQAAKLRAEMAFPSIVVQMQSNAAPA